MKRQILASLAACGRRVSEYDPWQGNPPAKCFRPPARAVFMMRMVLWLGLVLGTALGESTAMGQLVPDAPEQSAPQPAAPTQAVPAQPVPQPAAPATAPATASPEQPAAPATPQAAAPAEPQPAAPTAQSGTVPIALHLENADLLQVVGIIASELHINYVVDPQVKGTVNINTLGEVQREDLFPLLQMILRINGATAVQTGSFYRIVPLENVQRLPIEPHYNASNQDLPADDRIVMNIIPLKYVSAVDMTKILTPFLSEGGHLFSQEAGNVLIITDSSRSMQRLMELVAQFDTDVFSNQRARLYPVKSSEATRVATELENVFSAYGLSGGSSAIRFVPIERVNSILVVTANPSVYPEVERWLERLDQPANEGGVRTFVYKVENAKAEDLADVLSQLLLGKSITPGTETGAVPGGGILMPLSGGNMLVGQPGVQSRVQPVVIAPQGGMSAAATSTGGAAGDSEQSHIRIVPDSINNQILIQATAQEYEDIKRTLGDLDIVPRQVMIEAKVFEVDLTGALSAGVSAASRWWPEESVNCKEVLPRLPPMRRRH
jgi:general secretion pathway protein D